MARIGPRAPKASGASSPTATTRSGRGDTLWGSPRPTCRPRSGLPKWLHQAFGPLYGEDLIDARIPTPEERERLEIPPDTPVVVIKGINRDSQHRPLHYIEKVTKAGRMQYGYRFGVVPED
jgi:hypothetical protein